MEISIGKQRARPVDYTQKQRSLGKEHHRALLPNTGVALVHNGTARVLMHMLSPVQPKKRLHMK